MDELRPRQLCPFAWAPYFHTPLPPHPEPQPAPDSFSCFPKYSGHWTACSLAHCLVRNRQGFILLPSPPASGVALVNKGVKTEPSALDSHTVAACVPPTLSMVIVYGDSPSPDQDSSPTASTVLCTKATVAGVRTRPFSAKVAFPLVSGLHEVGGGQATTYLRDPGRVSHSTSSPRLCGRGHTAQSSPGRGRGQGGEGGAGPALRGVSRSSAAAAASFTEAGAGSAAVADLNASCSCGCAATSLRTGEPRELLSTPLPLPDPSLCHPCPAPVGPWMCLLNSLLSVHSTAQLLPQHPFLLALMQLFRFQIFLYRLDFSTQTVLTSACFLS